MSLIDFGAKTNNIDEKIINLDKLTNLKEITAGYMSPINIIHKQLYEQINMQLDNNVVKAVAECGIEVNKEELIKALQYDRQQYDKGFNDGYKASMQQWIPCSERLPKEDGRYLCFWGTGVMQTFRFSNDLYAVDDYDFYEYEGKNKKKGFYDYDSECGYYEIDYITAWMPLPAPYKEGGAE